MPVLCDYLQAKIADFGLLVREENDENQVAGTLGYLDPEYFNSQKVTLKSDVYR